MKQNTSSRLLLGGICVLLLTMGYATWQIVSLNEEVHAVVQHMQKAYKMQPDYHTEWTDAEGLQHEVNTNIGEPGHEGEDADAAAVRHAAKVTALKNIYPPE